MKCYYCDAEKGVRLDGCPNSPSLKDNPHGREIAFISFDYGNGCYLPGWLPNCEINGKSRNLGEEALIRHRRWRDDGGGAATIPDHGSGWASGIDTRTIALSPSYMLGFGPPRVVD